MWIFRFCRKYEIHKTDTPEVAEIAKKYQEHREDGLYQSIMDVIVRANRESFREAKDMCSAILELFEDEVVVIKEQVKQEECQRYLDQIMKNLNLTAEQATDALGISMEERAFYQKLKGSF